MIIYYYRYGIEGTVFINNNNQTNLLEEETYSLFIDNYKFKIQLFDRIKVEISVDETKYQLKLLCISPPIHHSSIVEINNNTTKKQFFDNEEQSSISHKKYKKNIT